MFSPRGDFSHLHLTRACFTTCFWLVGALRDSLATWGQLEIRKYCRRIMLVFKENMYLFRGNPIFNNPHLSLSNKRRILGPGWPTYFQVFYAIGRHF